LTSKENQEQNNELLKKLNQNYNDTNKNMIDHHVEMTQKQLEKSFNKIKLKK
jgi:hypothetical protein